MPTLTRTLPKGRYQNGLSELFKLMKPNQAIFVHHLRTNPNNLVQIEGELVGDDGKSACAIGLGMEAFDMIRRYRAAEESGYGASAFDPYKYIAETLEMPRTHVDQIYSLNDDHGQSFEEIADIMEQYFTKGNLFAWDAQGPEDLWNAAEAAVRDERLYEFKESFEAYQAELRDVIERAAMEFGIDSYVLEDGGLEGADPEEFFDEYVDPARDQW